MPLTSNKECMNPKNTISEQKSKKTNVYMDLTSQNEVTKDGLVTEIEQLKQRVTSQDNANSQLKEEFVELSKLVQQTKRRQSFQMLQSLIFAIVLLVAVAMAAVALVQFQSINTTEEMTKNDLKTEEEISRSFNVYLESRSINQTKTFNVDLPEFLSQPFTLSHLKVFSSSPKFPDTFDVKLLNVSVRTFTIEVSRTDGVHNAWGQKPIFTYTATKRY